MSDEDRIIRVAHALCVADGQDPEARITVGTESLDVGDVTWTRDAVAPAWTSYVGEARRMIAALGAMGLVG